MEFRAYHVPWMLCGLLVGGCDCSPASHSPNDAAASEQPAGEDAGERDASGPSDAEADAARPGPDGGSFATGWERVPFLPDWCDAWQPKGNAADVIDELEFEACDPPSTGCETMVVDWPRSRFDSYLGAGEEYQTWGRAGLVGFRRPFISDAGREYSQEGLYTLDGVPLAVWRLRQISRERDTWCTMLAFGVSEESLALAFQASTGHYAETGDPDDFSVRIVEGPKRRIQHDHEVLYDLGPDDLLHPGNAPRRLLYDGESVIVAGTLGAVYLGSWRGGPWGEIATARTDDYQNANGWLHDGAFFWSSTNGRRFRIRRRRPDATDNETFYRNEHDWLGAFRIDDEWAVWVNSLDRSPIDGDPERTEIRAARVGESPEPSEWDVRVYGEFEFPTSIKGSNPLFWNGRYAYMVDEKTVEVLDLNREEKLVLRIPGERELWWNTVLYLGPRYLMVTHKGTSGITGLRRYDLDEVEGWKPVEVKSAGSEG